MFRVSGVCRMFSIVRWWFFFGRCLSYLVVECGSGWWCVLVSCVVLSIVGLLVVIDCYDVCVWLV